MFCIYKFKDKEESFLIDSIIFIDIFEILLLDFIFVRFSKLIWLNVVVIIMCDKELGENIVYWYK